MTAEDYFAAGDRVVVPMTLHARTEGTDAVLEQRTTALWTFRDGRVVHVRYYDDEAAAFEAAGLSRHEHASGPRLRAVNKTARISLKVSRPGGSTATRPRSRMLVGEARERPAQPVPVLALIQWVPNRTSNAELNTRNACTRYCSFQPVPSSTHFSG